MRAEATDIVFLCDHCGAGAVLEEEGLAQVESTAFLPAPGRRASLWRPAWILESQVLVDKRIDAKGRRTPSRRFDATFVIPAFALPLPDLTALSRALSRAAGAVGEVPREPITGGTMSLEDARTFARHLMVGDEVSQRDKLASVEVVVTVNSHRLAAIPIERKGEALSCAVTGVGIRSAL
jgi:hypothetical protein